MMEKVALATANGDPIFIKKYDDVCFPDTEYIEPENGIKRAKNFKYKPGDIMYCSYPKSGTHWICNMALKLTTFDESKWPPGNIIEFDLQGALDGQEGPRGLISHQPPKYLPKEHIENNGKIVLMLRNPKDVLVSYYYHMKNALMFKNKQSFDEFYISFNKGIVPMGSYYNYLAQWEQFIHNNGNVEVFYYENCQRNHKSNLERLNKFTDLNRDQKYVERVLKETTFEALKEQAATRDQNMYKTHAAVRDENGKSIIYRKGQVGDWKNHMTKEQSEEIDGLLQEKLKLDIIKFE